jgi:hypothetical protein
MRKTISIISFLMSFSILLWVINRFAFPKLSNGLQIEIQIIVTIFLGVLAFLSQIKDSIELFTAKQRNEEDLVFFDPTKITSSKFDIAFLKSLPTFSLPRRLYQNWIGHDDLQQSIQADTLVYAVTAPSYYYLERLPLILLAEYSLMVIIVTTLLIFNFQLLVWIVLGLWIFRIIYIILKRVRKESTSYYLITDLRIIRFTETRLFRDQEIMINSISSVGTFIYLFRTNMGEIVIRSSVEVMDIDHQQNPSAISSLIKEIWEKTKVLDLQERKAKKNKELAQYFEKFSQSEAKTKKEAKPKKPG